MKKFRNMKDFDINVDGKRHCINEEFYADETSNEVKNLVREKYIERLK